MTALGSAMAMPVAAQPWVPTSGHSLGGYGGSMGHETSGVRHSLQLADYLIQCGDSARAAEIYLRLAAAYAERRRTQEAAAICYRVLHVDASQFVDVAVATTLRRLGRAAGPICGHAADVHQQAGRYGDALRMFQLAAELDSSDALASVRLAEAFLAQHDYRQGVSALFEAGQRLVRDGNNADFLVLADQILAIDPRHAPTLRELARAHVRLGEPHRAVDLLARLMEVVPEDAGGYEILAQAFASIGRTLKALSILTRLVHDRRRVGDEPGAQGMLDRAQWWSAEDAFRQTLAALREPSTPRRVVAATPAREATVMLSLGDIMVEEERDLEGTLVLALDDLAFIEASKHRARRPVAPARTRTGRKTPPPPPPPSLRRALPPRPQAASSATIVLDLGDLMEDGIDEEMQRLVSLAIDEDSGARDPDADEAPTAVRKNPVLSARAPAPPIVTARDGVPSRAPKAPTMRIQTRRPVQAPPPKIERLPRPGGKRPV